MSAYDQVIAQIVAKYGSVKDFQKKALLDADGICGEKTARNFALMEGGHPPIPQGRGRLDDVYGSFDFAKDPDPKKRGITIAGSWVAKNIVRVALHTGVSVRMHRLVADEFASIFQDACAAAGQTPKSVQTFVPRYTNGRKNLSLHSWGIAVDFDPMKNPCGGHNSWMRTAAGQKFVQVFEEHGWTWGGRWSFKDDMHFQRCYQ